VSARQADWVVDGIIGFAESVLSLVPAGFDAYGRIFHPAGVLDGREWKSVRWETIAAANDTQAHAGMQLGAIMKADPWSWGPIPDRSVPEHGNLPAALAEPLTGILRAHTTTPETCWFAIWEGYGALSGDIRLEPSFELPHRRYHLLQGPIEALDVPCDPPFVRQTPNIWWPDDRAWCVATEVDLDSTYVGGSAACIAALAASTELEAHAIDPAHGITSDSDTVNHPAR
jgi:hypothetical protein